MAADDCQPVRLLIADDHELAREGLRGMLKRDPQIDVEVEAASDTEAIRLCRRWRPDLVLMDVRIPPRPGLQQRVRFARRTPARVCWS